MERPRSDIISIAILAGGRSSRMGRNKALADLAGRPLIGHVIESLRRLSDDMFIVGGQAVGFRQFGLPHVADQYAECASIVGVYTAVAAARNNYCLVVSCDMPFAPAELAKCMAELAVGHDAVVPMAGSQHQPLFALYSKECLEVLGGQIERQDMALKNALSRLDIQELEPWEKHRIDPEVAFMNVNTEEDLKKAERILLQKRPEAQPILPEGEPFAASSGAAVRPPLICFVGKKNSGKTTFLEKLVALLVSQGLKVAFIKHDAHAFEIDREGTDTWRITQAGASEITISSPDALATIKQVDLEPGLDELCAGVGARVNIIVAEGFKTYPADKIEISRSVRSTELVCREEELIAVISDRPEGARAVPVFGLEDTRAVARLLIERYALVTKKVRS